MLRRRHIAKTNQRGDTIVEVMIVLAVLGLAIGISYSTANTALLQARAAQENTKATEILQAEIEQLRTLASNKAKLDDGVTPNTGKYVYITPTNGFCIANGSTVTPINDPATDCIANGVYHIKIKYDPVSGTFALTAVWPNVQGKGDDNVAFSYRVYPTE